MFHNRHQVRRITLYSAAPPASSIPPYSVAQPIEVDAVGPLCVGRSAEMRTPRMHIHYGSVFV